jgi:hypothetical protein
VKVFAFDDAAYLSVDFGAGDPDRLATERALGATRDLGRPRFFDVRVGLGLAEHVRVGDFVFDAREQLLGEVGTLVLGERERGFEELASLVAHA